MLTIERKGRGFLVIHRHDGREEWRSYIRNEAQLVLAVDHHFNGYHNFPTQDCPFCEETRKKRETSP
jgi:aminoglycoside phosphotransferase